MYLCTLDSFVYTSAIIHPSSNPLGNRYLAPFNFEIFNYSQFEAPHLPVTFNTDERLLQLWNAYQQKNPLPGVTDFWGVTPKSLAKRSGLDSRR
jgi:hypothetical protein